jgi:hypothetical protein
MKNNNLKHLSTRHPTYWLSDSSKIPDLIDFCVTKGIGTKKFTAESSLELTSDHTPILITMFTHILGKSNKPFLYSKHTNWNCFKETVDEQITLEMPLKLKYI